MTELELKEFLSRPNLVNLIHNHERNGYNGFNLLPAGEHVVKDPETKVPLDAEMSLYLVHDCVPVAVSGISTSLTDYYDFDSMLPEDTLIYGAIAAALERKYTVTHLQTMPGMKSSRTQIRWRHLLIRAWEEFAREKGADKLYILPAEFNKWEMPSVREQLSDLHKPYPSLEVLKQNYNYIAKRLGYKRNSAVCWVFEKQL